MTTFNILTYDETTRRIIQTAVMAECVVPRQPYIVIEGPPPMDVFTHYEVSNDLALVPLPEA